MFCISCGDGDDYTCVPRRLYDIGYCETRHAATAQYAARAPCCSLFKSSPSGRPQLQLALIPFQQTATKELADDRTIKFGMMTNQRAPFNYSWSATVRDSWPSSDSRSCPFQPCLLPLSFVRAASDGFDGRVSLTFIPKRKQCWSLATVHEFSSHPSHATRASPAARTNA